MSEICNPKAVIFDMDGVIFESESVWKMAFQKANEEFGLSLTENDRQSMCGKNEKIIRDELRNQIDVNVDLYRDYMIKVVDEIVMNRGVPLKPHFIDFIDYLKTNNYKIALATSSKKDRAIKMFNKVGMKIEKLFDVTVFGEEVINSKPNPEIFLSAASKLEVAPNCATVLEDSINGIRAAKLGGFNCIMVVDIIKPDDYVNSLNIPIIYDLEELVKMFRGCHERNKCICME